MKYKKGMVGIAALLLLSLAACKGFIEGPSLAPEKAAKPTHTEAILPTATEEGKADVQPTTQDLGETADPEAGSGEAESKPTARVGLQATDPETVMLASGEIQLVEFFAFW